MSRFIARLLVVGAVALVIWPYVCVAQVADHFDTSHAITIQGSFAGLFVPPGQNAYLVIDGRDAAGHVETWALQGNGIAMLMSAGWRVREMPMGGPVVATAFALKPDAKALDIVPPSAPEQVQAAAKAGRFLHGIDVVFPDGKTLPFGPGK
jgi:hypothetical protein